jgi:hypothetical protein
VGPEPRHPSVPVSCPVVRNLLIHHQHQPPLLPTATISQARRQQSEASQESEL